MARAGGRGSKLGADLPASSSPTRPTNATSRAPSSARLARPRATFAALPPGLLPRAQGVNRGMWRMWRLAADMIEQAPPLPGAGAAPQRALQRGHLCFGHEQAAAQAAAQPMRVIHVRDAVHHGVTQRYHCLRFPDGRHGAAAMCVETSVQCTPYTCLLVRLLIYASLWPADLKPELIPVAASRCAPNGRSLSVSSSPFAQSCCLPVHRHTAQVALLDLGAEPDLCFPGVAASKTRCTTADSILLPVHKQRSSAHCYRRGGSHI